MMRRSAIIVGLMGMLVSIVNCVSVLADVDWDPTIFTAFGVEATPTREYAETRLGDVFLRPEQGHDGKFFFVQANDPWVTHPEENALVLDRPLYRSQRMLYPVLAGGGGLFGPLTIVWSMLLVNLLAMGVGTWAVARIAIDMGGSPWWGLAFALNLGFINEVNIGGAGVIAAAAAFCGVLAIMRSSFSVGIVLLVLAALAREAMLIAAAGIALWLWFEGRRADAALTAGIPALAVVAWGAYLRWRIGVGAAAAQVEEIGWPFVGFVEAFGGWLGDPFDLAVGVAIMILFIVFSRRVLISNRPVGWAFLGFVALGVVFTEQVWHSYFDITRAVAPIITSFALVVFVGPAASVAGDGERPERNSSSDSVGDRNENSVVRLEDE